MSCRKVRSWTPCTIGSFSDGKLHRCPDCRATQTAGNPAVWRSSNLKSRQASCFVQLGVSLAATGMRAWGRRLCC